MFSLVHFLLQVDHQLDTDPAPLLHLQVDHQLDTDPPPLLPLQVDHQLDSDPPPLIPLQVQQTISLILILLLSSLCTLTHLSFPENFPDDVSTYYSRFLEPYRDSFTIFLRPGKDLNF